MVAHTYNPGYSGCRNQEDCSLRPAWTKSLQNHISTKGWVQWHMPVITWGSTNKRILVQASLGVKQDLISKTVNSKRAGGAAQVVEYLPWKCEG
jgi:hypothetical protein